VSLPVGFSPCRSCAHPRCQRVHSEDQELAHRPCGELYSAATNRPPGGAAADCAALQLPTLIYNREILPLFAVAASCRQSLAGLPRCAVHVGRRLNQIADPDPLGTPHTYIGRESA